MGTAHPLFWGAAKDGRDGNTGEKGGQEADKDGHIRNNKRLQILASA